MFYLMIAEKCVIITDYLSNSKMANYGVSVSILTSSSSYVFYGSGEVYGVNSTKASFIGLKSEKYMSFSFFA